MAEEESSTTTTEEITLENTPTWAVATVCFIMLLISIFLEHLLQLLARYFQRKGRKSLLQALDKVKSALMLMGFISLLLTVGEKPISKICIPEGVSDTFLPCGTLEISAEEEETECPEGKVPFLSRAGMRQLQYLIFVLAFFHSLSCILTFGLGMAKMRKWESWEAETKTLEYQFSNDPRRFKLAHQTSFARRHLRFWSDHSLLRWPVVFFRQFYSAVSKVDYFTLRHGFVTAHFSQDSNFNFQNYIKRALERDFGVVVGTSFWIWMLAVVFIFFHAHLFYDYYWLPFPPLMMLLLVGTKLQGIITKMCVDSHNNSHVVRGTLLVRPSDDFFWFGSPRLLLHILHFVLFQNSFQLAFFTWTWFKFGFRSCFHRRTEDIVIRIVMGVLVQLLCGYVTLPLYALVTQMGTCMDASVFPEKVIKGLKRWKHRARKNLALRNPYYYSRPSLDASVTSIGTSPSFSTLSLDASISGLDQVDQAYDAEVLPSIKADDHIDCNEKQPYEQYKKKGSFDGFVVNSDQIV